MDFELARFIMIKSIISPKQLYLHTKRSKQIKNQWHRDDPCLTSVNVTFLLLCAFLVCLAMSPARRGFSLGSLLLDWMILSFCFVVIHFVLYGVGVAALSRFIAHKYLRRQSGDTAPKSPGTAGSASSKGGLHAPAGGH